MYTYEISREEALEDPDTALDYSRDVIKGRFHEAETLILSDLDIAYLYARDVIHGRWPDLEVLLLENNNLSLLYEYTHDAVRGSWPNAEVIFDKDDYYHDLYKAYLKFVSLNENGIFCTLMQVDKRSYLNGCPITVSYVADTDEGYFKFINREIKLITKLDIAKKV